MKKLIAFWIHEVDVDPESGIGKFIGEFTKPILADDNEPKYEWLRGKLGCDMVEHVGVAPGISVWCDEEFRLKSNTRASAIIKAPQGGSYDFGGAIVITARSQEKLIAFLESSVRVPPVDFELAEPHMEFYAEPRDAATATGMYDHDDVN